MTEKKITKEDLKVLKEQYKKLLEEFGIISARKVQYQNMLKFLEKQKIEEEKTIKELEVKREQIEKELFVKGEELEKVEIELVELGNKKREIDLNPIIKEIIKEIEVSIDDKDVIARERVCEGIEAQQRSFAADLVKKEQELNNKEAQVIKEAQKINDQIADSKKELAILEKQKKEIDLTPQIIEKEVVKEIVKEVEKIVEVEVDSKGVKQLQEKLDEFQKELVDKQEVLHIQEKRLEKKEKDLRDLDKSLKDVKRDLKIEIGRKNLAEEMKKYSKFLA